MDQQEIFEIELDGQPIPARTGQTIAEALLNNGIRTFRRTTNNAPRGVYCNMGTCYECRMIVNGIPNIRACMTPATPGCKVITQKDSDIKVEDERS